MIIISLPDCGRLCSVAFDVRRLVAMFREDICGSWEPQCAAAVYDGYRQLVVKCSKDKRTT